MERLFCLLLFLIESVFIPCFNKHIFQNNLIMFNAVIRVPVTLSDKCRYISQCRYRLSSLLLTVECLSSNQIPRSELTNCIGCDK